MTSFEVPESSIDWVNVFIDWVTAVVGEGVRFMAASPTTAVAQSMKHWPNIWNSLVLVYS